MSFRMFSFITEELESGKVPVEHLDYEFIQKCSDVKYLKKIVRVLRSGEEGLYPHLEDFCEKHIAELNTNSPALCKEKSQATAACLSAKEKKQITEDLQKEFDQGASACKKNVPPRDYREWVKFDFEKECAKIDEGITEQNSPAAINQPMPIISEKIDAEVLTVTERAALVNREKVKGNEAFRANDFEEAVAYYTRSLSVMPTAVVYNNRAQASIQLQNWHSALGDCEKVLELEPGNVKALLRRATAQKELGNLKTAACDLRNVLQVEPHNGLAKKLLDDIEKKETVISSGDQRKFSRMVTEEVKDDNDEVLTDTKRAALANREKEKGNEAFRANDFEEAVAYYTRSLSVMPTAVLYNNRAQASIKLQDWHSALSDCEKVLELEPGNVKALLRRATAQKELGNLKMAANDLRNVLQVEPHNEIAKKLLEDIEKKETVISPGDQRNFSRMVAEEVKDDDDEVLTDTERAALANREKEKGNKAFRANDFEEAVACYTRSLSAMPTAEVYDNRAEANIELQDWHSAISDSEKALELEPGNVKVLTDTKRAALANHEKEKGDEAFRANDFEEAVTYFTRTLSVMPTAEAYNNGAEASIKLQDWHSAISDSEKALELEPGDVKVLTDTERAALANSEKEKGNEAFRANDFEEAVAYYTRSLSVMPTAVLYNNRAQASIKLQDWHSALSDCEKVLELEPGNVKALLRRATAQKELGNLKMAANDLRNVLQVEPHNEIAKKLLEDIEKKETVISPGDQRKFSRMVTEEVKDDDDEVLTDSERAALANREKEKGNKAFRANDFEEAVACYTRSLSLMPTAEVYDNRAEANIELQDWHSAISDSEKALELEPGNVKVLTDTKRAALANHEKEKGNETFRANDFEEAVTYFTRILSVMPTAEVYNNGAEASIKLQDWHSAISDSEKALELEPGDVKVLTDTERAALANSEKEKGNEAFRANDFEEAVAYYTRSLSMMPTAVLYNNRAQASIKLQDWHSALSDCEKVLELEPGNVKALLRRATAQKELGNLEMAANDLRNVLQVEPHNEIAKKLLEDIEKKETVISPGDQRKFSRMVTEEVKDDDDEVLTHTERAALANHEKEKGNKAFRANDFEEAVACYTRTLSVMPTAEVYNNGAEASIKLQDWHSAISDSEKALELEPGDVKVLTDTERAALANSEKEKGNEAFRANDFEEAVAYYTRSLSVMPTAVLYNNRAQASIKLQDWHSALSDCEKVLELEPGNVKALLRRATAQKELGNLKMAANDLRNVLQVEPHNEIAKKLLEDIEKKETVISPGDQRKFSRMVTEEVKDDDDEVLTDTERAALANREKEKGNKAFRANDFEEAVACYTRSLSAMPTAEVYDNRAEANIELQDWHSAISDSEKALELDPGNVKVLTDTKRAALANHEKEKGNEAFRANDFEEAVTYFTRILSVMPTAEVNNNGAEASIKLQDWHSAISDSEKALELEPGDVKVLTDTERAALANSEKEKGNEAFQANDFEEAVAYYTRSLSVMPTAEVYDNQAEANIKLQDWHSALGDCEKVLELEPGNVKALLRRATAQKELGNLKTAANDLRNVLLVEPHNDIAKKLLEDIEKEETVISPGDQMKFSRMVTEEVKDDDDEVLTDTERAALAHLEKETGNEAFRANDFEEAVACYTRSLSVMPTAEVYNNRAEARIKLALSDCEKALELEPGNVKALLHHATAQKELGNLKTAACDLRNVLQVEPHNDIAKKLLEDIEKKETVISPGDQMKFTRMVTEEVKDDDDEAAPAEPRQHVGGQSVAAKNAHKEPPGRGDGGPAAEHAHHGPLQGKKGSSCEHRAPEPLKKDLANGAQTSDGSAGAQPSGDQSAGSGGADDSKLDAPAGALPPPLARLKNEGNLLFKNGQFADALEKYSQAIAGCSDLGIDSPEDLSILYSNRAACHLKDGNSTDCIQDCNRALELQPFSLKPLLRRAVAHESLERYRKAYVDYETVLQIDIGMQSAHDSVNRITKLLIEEDGPDWQEKIPEIPLVPLSAQQQRREEPPSEELARARAARAAQETARRADAQFTSRKQEGNDCVKRGQYQEAVEKYSECLKLKPEECAIYTNRALCYLKLELFNEAKQDCDSALLLEPSNKKAFYRRALAYKGLKEHLACSSDLQEVLRLDPSVQEAERELQEVSVRLRESLAAEASPGKPWRRVPITEDGPHPKGNHCDGKDLRILLQPTNAFEFECALSAVRSCGNTAACAQLLQAVAPETLPEYFGNKLDGHTIQFIIQVFDEHLLQKDPNLVYQHLSHLHTAERFSLVLMLLDDNDRRQMTRLFEHLSAAETGEFSVDDVQNLANKYI